MKNDRRGKNNPMYGKKGANQYTTGKTQRKGYSEYADMRGLRLRVFEDRGRKCSRCGWDEVNPFSKIIPVEMHHKNGNKANSDSDNLEVLCPNCHSMTEHYKNHRTKIAR